MTSQKVDGDGAATTPPTTSAPATRSATTPDQTSAASAEVALVDQPGPLVSDQGRTSISDTVVAKIAGIATREVVGVHDLGGGTARAVGALRSRIPGGVGSNLTQGVGVEVGERQTAIDLEVVTDYGAAIAEVATAIRTHVVESVESMTGLEVTEVNITVLDVHVGDEDDAEPEARVE